MVSVDEWSKQGSRGPNFLPLGKILIVIYDVVLEQVPDLDTRDVSVQLCHSCSYNSFDNMTCAFLTCGFAVDVP